MCIFFGASSPSLTSPLRNFHWKKFLTCAIFQATEVGGFVIIITKENLSQQIAELDEEQLPEAYAESAPVLLGLAYY